MYTIWVHNKTGNKYAVLEKLAFDVTNARDGLGVVVYQSLDNDTLYVRERAEFESKFTRQAASGAQQLPHEVIADQMAAENVRRLLCGTIQGAPLVGTLAYRVWSNLPPDWRPFTDPDLVLPERYNLTNLDALFDSWGRK